MLAPSDYYRFKCAEIGDAETRLVAACLSDHIGEDNAVRVETIAARAGINERQVRDILETLTTEHGWPIGAHSGKAGRWIIESEDERWRVVRDLDSRLEALYSRRAAIVSAKIPSELELKLQSPTLQEGLF